MTKRDKAYMSAVADLGCFLCHMLGYGKSPAELHHIRLGAGTGKKNSSYLIIPVCPTHHRDKKDGIQHERHAWKLAGYGELDGIAWVNEKIFKMVTK